MHFGVFRGGFVLFRRDVFFRYFFQLRSARSARIGELVNQTQDILAGGGDCSELVSSANTANIGCTDDLAIM